MTPPPTTSDMILVMEALQLTMNVAGYEIPVSNEYRSNVAKCRVEIEKRLAELRAEERQIQPTKYRTDIENDSEPLPCVGCSAPPVINKYGGVWCERCKIGSELTQNGVVYWNTFVRSIRERMK